MSSPLFPQLEQPISAEVGLASVRITEVLVQVICHVGVTLLQEAVLSDDHREVKPSDVLGCRLERHHGPEVPDDRQAPAIRCEVRLHDIRISIEGAKDLSLATRYGHDQRPHPIDHCLHVVMPDHLPVRADPAMNPNARICWLTGHLLSPQVKSI